MGFTTKWSCSCNMQYSEHKTIIENRADKGGDVGETEVERMLNDPGLNGKDGRMTNFMDMVDGSERYGSKIEEMEQLRVSQTIS